MSHGIVRLLSVVAAAVGIALIGCGVAHAEPAGSAGTNLGPVASASHTVPSRDDLVRRWVPVSVGGTTHPKPPFVELRADGSWVGSDGCNGLSGTWSLGPAGRWEATVGPSTKIFCDNVPVGDWLDRATQVRLDGDILVLTDAAGQVTGRFRPA